MHFCTTLTSIILKSIIHKNQQQITAKWNIYYSKSSLHFLKCKYKLARIQNKYNLMNSKFMTHVRKCMRKIQNEYIMGYMIYNSIYIKPCRDLVSKTLRPLN